MIAKVSNGAIVQGNKSKIILRRIAGYFLTSPLVLVIILLGVILTFTTRSFMTGTNLLNVLRQVSFNMILATGQTFVLISGGVDLSVGTGLALVGCISALVMLKYGIVWGILAGLATGLTLGLVNGFLVYKIKLPPFIVTLGTMTIAGGLSLYTTGGAIIFGLPEKFRYLGQGYIGFIPVPVVFSLVILAFGIFLLHKTNFGLKVYAIGGNFEAARLSGINTSRVQFYVYLLSGLCAAVAGILLTSRVASAQPAYGKGYELLSVAAVLIGGTSLFGGEGKIWMTAFGAILLGVLSNGLNLMGVEFFWHDVVIGVVIILAVTFEQVRKMRKII